MLAVQAVCTFISLGAVVYTTLVTREARAAMSDVQRIMVGMKKGLKS